MLSIMGFPQVVGLGVVLAMAGADVTTNWPSPESVRGWQRYAAAIEARRATERRDAGRFLALDFLPDAAAERRTLMAGNLVVQAMDAYDARGSRIDVPSAMVHHWRGAVFLRGATLERLMATLETEAPPTGPEVLNAAVLSRRPGAMQLFLRLQRTKLVTVVYNTEHDVTFTHEAPGRASSVSVATKIAEIADANKPSEHELPPGGDSGYLWRLNAYWRYQSVPGGVIAECESISLSRDVPFGLQYIAGPLIRSTARESMTRALEEIRKRG
jgi:hypothetical protein